MLGKLTERLLFERLLMGVAGGPAREALRWSSQRKACAG